VLCVVCVLCVCVCVCECVCVQEEAEKGRQPEEYGRVPDTYGAIVDVCKSALLLASTDAAFWDEGVRALFPAPLEGQEQVC
jgi:hypothetical protein